jgi:hypothetical protein
MGDKCYLTLKGGPFARQNYKDRTMWDPRGPYEIGGAFYYSQGQLQFGEHPVAVVGYKDIAFERKPLGMFRVLCGRDKDHWSRLPRDAAGAALYIREAQDLFLNGFSPEVVRNHRAWGDAVTYEELCPAEQAFKANSLQEVRDREYTPTNMHQRIQ